jgi:predicted proteasome-type protease
MAQVREQDSAAANAADTEASQAAVEDAQSSGSEGDLVVLTSGFVARTDSKNQTTRRHRRGEKFHPLEGIHDVESLIAQKVLGRVGKDAKLKPSTALDVAKAQAELHQEESPVIDLSAQPFEQVPVSKDEQDDAS